MAELIVTTTPTVEGRMATHYLGVVAGEAIMGANIFRDICRHPRHRWRPFRRL